MITLYHGSNVEIGQIDLSLSRKGKDFGCGLYYESAVYVFSYLQNEIESGVVK